MDIYDVRKSSNSKKRSQINKLFRAKFEMTIFLDAHWFHAVSIDGIEKIAKPLFNLEFDEGNIANVIESWMNKWTNKADSADSFIRSLVKVSDVLTEVIFLNFFFSYSPFEEMAMAYVRIFYDTQDLCRGQLRKRTRLSCISWNDKVKTDFPNIFHVSLSISLCISSALLLCV